MDFLKKSLCARAWVGGGVFVGVCGCSWALTTNTPPPPHARAHRLVARESSTAGALHCPPQGEDGEGVAELFCRACVAGCGVCWRAVEQERCMDPPRVRPG
jgi:hypothetical protein